MTPRGYRFRQSSDAAFPSQVPFFQSFGMAGRKVFGGSSRQGIFVKGGIEIDAVRFVHGFSSVKRLV